MSKFTEEIDKLAVLVVVAEKRKISAAAEILHLSQPSITRAIQKLEAAFGAEIFVRRRDGVELTPAGEILYERAAKFMRELDDIQAQAKNLGNEMVGNLTVGTYESLAEYMWPEFLIKLQKIHPELNLSVKTNFNQDPWGDLTTRRIDLLVDAEPQSRAAFASWPLYKDKFSFFVGVNSSLKELTPDAAKTESIIFVQQAFDENRVTLEEHLEKEGYKFARQYNFDSFSTVKRLVSKGLGVGVLPQRLAKEDLKKKLIKSITVKGFSKLGFGDHSIFATVASENRKDPRIKEIIRLLKGHLN